MKTRMASEQELNDLTIAEWATYLNGIAEVWGESMAQSVWEHHLQMWAQEDIAKYTPSFDDALDLINDIYPDMDDPQRQVWYWEAVEIYI